MNNASTTPDKKNLTEENKDQPSQSEEQKMAVNPNPAANANIKETPFEKNTGKEDPAEEVGSEITDGEGG